MTVDLAKARPGCEVQFRCGGKAMINHAKCTERIVWRSDRTKRLMYSLGLDNSYFDYLSDGGWINENDKPHPFDIISITDPPLTEAERLAEIAKIAEKTDRLIERVLLDQDHFDFGAWRKRNAEILALAEGRAP